MGESKSFAAMTEEEAVVTRKTALRSEMLVALRALAPEERSRRSRVICQRVLDSEGWQIAARVLLFSPMRTEVDVSSLTVAALTAAKEMAVMPKTLRSEAELELPFVPDLILVPGLAFSRDRHRLGRGGGFYDRLLCGRGQDALKVGVCFAFQLHDTIPVSGHDILMDAVITD